MRLKMSFLLENTEKSLSQKDWEEKLLLVSVPALGQGQCGVGGQEAWAACAIWQQELGTGLTAVAEVVTCHHQVVSLWKQRCWSVQSGAAGKVKTDFRLDGGSQGCLPS